METPIKRRFAFGIEMVFDRMWLMIKLAEISKHFIIGQAYAHIVTIWSC